MTAKLYYTAPSDEIFDEVKRAAIELWTNEYPADKHPYYAEEKVGQIQNWKNVQDNVMALVQMFDSSNQLKLGRKLSEQAKEAIRDRFIDGGLIREFCPF